MSDNVINLRQVRKQRERAARRKQADENREKHGRTKTEREQIARDAASKSAPFRRPLARSAGARHER